MKESFGVISEADEEYMKTSEYTHLKQQPKPYSKLAYERSDEEILRIYKNMVGDNSQDQPKPAIWQETVSTTHIKLDSPARPAKTSLATNMQLVSTPSKLVDKNSSNPPPKSVHVISKEILKSPGQNKTNYSQGYAESKPFSLKKSVKTTTVYRDESLNNPPSPQPSVKQSTTDHFKRRLVQNVIKDKEDYTSRIGRTVMQMRVEDKKLRQQIKTINREEHDLQESIRKYHLQYRSYCREIEDRHDVSYTLKHMEYPKEILTLDVSHKSRPSCRRTQIVEEYKSYTDKIELEIRRLDYMLELKAKNVEKEEISVAGNRLTPLLLEPMNEEERSLEEEGPPVEGPTYKEIMKARKTKKHAKLQQLLGEGRQEDNVVKEPAPEISSIAYKSQINTYDTEEGQLRVNEHLRNLLLE